MWSPDCNPCNYYLWGRVEEEACATSHKNVDSLKVLSAAQWPTWTLWRSSLPSVHSGITCRKSLMPIGDILNKTCSNKSELAALKVSVWYFKQFLRYTSMKLFLIYLRTLVHHSHLSNCHQRLYSNRLQQWPNLHPLLRQYEIGYHRKAAWAVSPEQVVLGLQVQEHMPESKSATKDEHKLCKCAVTLMYCEGLHYSELRDLKVWDISCNENAGVWVNCEHVKEKDVAEKNCLLFPFNVNCTCFTLLQQRKMQSGESHWQDAWVWDVVFEADQNEKDDLRWDNRARQNLMLQKYIN